MDTTAPERSTLTTDDSPRLRASDVERTAIVDVLQDAMARGLLTHEEGDERMTAAFAARFRDELPLLIADLPPAGAAAAPAAGAPGAWRGVSAAVITLVRQEIAATAASGFRSRRFLVAALVVLALLGGLALVGHVFLDGGPGAHLPDHGER